ncbi:MAG TPA: transglycosylase SLT domain-containing protein [Casimicrobiaceae bacterium]|nr:transglycosylase SLT domain-containing protein [Casimicrobiaceae bacterium]
MALPEDVACVPRMRRLACLVATSVGMLASTAFGAEFGSTSTRAELVAQALAYEHGEGVAKDQRRAALLYCEAARGGDPEGAFALGWMYANGRGVARSDAMAAFLFARAAAAGHAYAREMQNHVGYDAVVMPDCMKSSEPEPPAMPVDNTPDPFADLPLEKKKIADLVAKTAPEYGIEPRLALAVIAVESNFRPEAQSARDARGLMQLISSTAARFKVRNRLDVKDNVRGGLAYLRWLLAYYQGEVTLAVAAYNAGEAAVDRYKGVPPYPETREYVKRVSQLFSNRRHSFDPSVAAPSPIVVSAEKTPGSKAP